MRRARAGREQFRGDGRVEVTLASLEDLLARDVVSLEGERGGLTVSDRGLPRLRHLSRGGEASALLQFWF